jgi:hypothetical protein
MTGFETVVLLGFAGAILINLLERPTPVPIEEEET